MRFLCLVVIVFILCSLATAHEMAYSGSEDQPIPLGRDCTEISTSGNYILDQDMVRRPEVDTPKPMPGADSKPYCTPEMLNSTEAYRCYPETGCLLINASNVSLDCQGHKIIIGDNIQDGIIISHNWRNVTIKNCIIDRPYKGIIEQISAETRSFINNSVINPIRSDGSHSQNLLGKYCTKISDPGEYVLIEDMMRRPEVDTCPGNASKISECDQFYACLTIKASNVTIDCQGNKIIVADWVQGGIEVVSEQEQTSRQGIDTGAVESPVINVSIRNCYIDRPFIGIRIYKNGKGINLYNNSVHSFYYLGYQIKGQDSILDCQGQKANMYSKSPYATADLNPATGILIGDHSIWGFEEALPKNQTVKNCIVEDPQRGIQDMGNFSVIYNNSVYNAGVIGFWILGPNGLASDNINVEEAPITEGFGVQYGFDISGSNYAIIGNTARGANTSCFEIESFNSTFISNNAEQCDYGFYIENVENNTLIGNEAKENRMDGFFIWRRGSTSPSGNVLRDNIARNNGRYGFNLDNEKNTLENNVDERNAYGSLFNNKLKELFDGLSMWFWGLFG